MLAALDADPDVRVLVVTGAGDKAFASGADISEFAALRTTPEARAEYDRGQAALTAAWASVGKPVIAMIRGFCMGGGLLTALQADIRIAADDSQFGIPAAPARARLRVRRRDHPDEPGQPGPGSGDPVFRASFPCGRGTADGARQPRRPAR